MTRPKLHEMPLEDAWPPRAGEITITMSVGQWDRVLQNSYNMGFILLELDADERPVRAYRKAAEA